MHRIQWMAVVLAVVMVFTGSGSSAWAASGLDKISDSSSEGAVISVGLFITVLAVLFIVGFKSDVENVFARHGDAATLARNLEADGALVQPVSAPAGLGLRLTF